MMPSKHKPQKIKLALIVPNFMWCDWDNNTRWRFIPYNLCLLAAAVKDIAEVVIIDANSSNMNEAEFSRSVADFNPDVAGITVLMDQYSPAGHYSAWLIKKLNPKIKTVMGGVYATMNPEKALSDTNLDYLIIGEGEYVLKDLLVFFSGRRTLPENGIAFRHCERIVNRGHSNFIEDLNSLPFPNYDLIDFASYVSTVPTRKSVDSPSNYPYTRIVTSRGCPYGCVFCQVESISGKKFRPRSPDNILSEIAFLKNRYGIKSLIFDDDNLYTDRKRALAIFQGLIDSNLAMPWISISAAAFRIDDEMLSLMHKSGCEYINIAVESGCERVLNEIVGKPLKLEQAMHVTEKARSLGIYVAANFIIGFPTETWDEILETVRFAEHLNADYIKLFTPIPLPKTRLWDLCIKTNTFKKDYSRDKVRWSTGQLESKDFRARDLTILRAYEWDRINFTDPGKRRRTAARMNITEAELLQIRRRTLYKASYFIEEHQNHQPLQAKNRNIYHDDKSDIREPQSING